VFEIAQAAAQLKSQSRPGWGLEPWLELRSGSSILSAQAKFQNPDHE
jgi:hypothetical protein